MIKPNVTVLRSPNIMTMHKLFLWYTVRTDTQLHVHTDRQTDRRTYNLTL